MPLKALRTLVDPVAPVGLVALSFTNPSAYGTSPNLGEEWSDSIARLESVPTFPLHKRAYGPVLPRLPQANGWHLPFFSTAPKALYFVYPKGP